jgi:hypothetical protein
MPSNVLENILAQSKKNKQILGIRTYKDNDNFWAGYVVDFNSDFVIFQHISKFGLKDGLNVEELKNIESIETDDDYLNALWLLVDNPLPAQAAKKIMLPGDTNWQLELLHANPTPGKVIAIDISNDLYTYGIVTEFDDTCFSVRCVGDSGQDEGIIVYRVADINAMQFDSLESRKRQKLYEWNLAVKGK